MNPQGSGVVVTAWRAMEDLLFNTRLVLTSTSGLTDLEALTVSTGSDNL